MVNGDEGPVEITSYSGEAVRPLTTCCIKGEKIWQAHQRKSREELFASLYMLEVLILIMRTQVHRDDTAMQQRGVE